MESAPLMIAIMGPTGSGKSEIAEKLAVRLDAVLINCDAFQVYKWLDIGTNKPADRGLYELIDICEPEEQFGLGEWLKRVEPIINSAFIQGRSVVFVGGTGLYIRALFEGYSDLMAPPAPALRENLMKLEWENGVEYLAKILLEKSPETAATVDLKNPVRVRRALEKLSTSGNPIRINVPPFNFRKFGLTVEGEKSRVGLEDRLDSMIEKGWIEEVQSLIDLRIPENAPGMRAIGYHTWRKFLSGATTFDEAKAEVLTLTVQYAKRQRTWLRKEPRLYGVSIEPQSENSRNAALASIWASILDLSGKENGQSN